MFIHFFAVDWMKQCGQGDQWYIEGNLNEAIDFDFKYQIKRLPQAAEVTVFLRQIQLTLRVDEPWTAFSDRLVAYFGLHRGAFFRIYPVDMDIQKLGDDDHSYSFDWEEGKQYWFDVVHDSGKDPHNLCRRIQMVDPSGRVESFVVPGQAEVDEVKALWRKMIDCPEDVTLEMSHRNNQEFYWGLSDASAAQLVNCTLRSQSNQMNVRIFNGSDAFKADQMSRILGIKAPPFSLCSVTPRPDGGAVLFYDGE
jgi:hypothetical protein